MSDFDQDEDLSQSLAAELTGTVGMADDVGPGDAVPNHVADLVEEQEAYLQDMPKPAGQEDDGQQLDESEQVEQQPQGKGPQQRVPLGALQEERRARQAAQEQARQLQEQLAAHQAQLQQFQQWQQQLAEQQQQEQIPDFNDDPEGFVKGKLAQVEQVLQQEQVRRQFEANVQQLDRELVQVGQHMHGNETEFRSQHPDYDEAAAFITRELDNRIAQQHPGSTYEQREMCRRLAVAEFYRGTVASGGNFAQMVYDKAAELGFQTQARTPRMSMKRPPFSLSNVPGPELAPDERRTVRSAKAIAAMSNQEFDDFWKEMERGATQVPWG